MSQIEKTEKRAELSRKEQAALDHYKRSDGRKISPQTEAGFFQLFIRGKSCEEIHRLNPGFHLGSIVSARIDGKWDEKLEEYRDSLMNSVASRVKQVELEAIDFVGDVLSATHRMHGDRIKRYMQTGDESELGDLAINSMQGYKTAVELLMRLTGQDKESRVQHNVQHTIETNTVLDVTQDHSSDLLKILEKKLND